MQTREELVLKGTSTSFPLVEVKWGGAISSGVPSSIINAKPSAISGSATIALRGNLSRAVDEDTYPELKSGVMVTLKAYEGDTLRTSLDLVITKVTFKYDEIAVSFSNDFLSLSNRVRCAPLAKNMPEGWNRSASQTDPWARGLGKVNTACSPMYGAFMAFRAAGFDCVPPIAGNTLVDIPMQWATVTNEWDDHSGHTYTSVSYNDSDGQPSLVWQNGMTYMSDGTVCATEMNNSKAGEVQGHFMAGVGQSDSVAVQLVFGGGNDFYVWAHGDRGVSVDGATVGGRVSLPQGTMNGVELVKFSCSKSKRAWWVEAGGKRLSGTLDIQGSRNTKGDTTLTGVWAKAKPGGRLAGVQVRNGYNDSTHYLSGEPEKKVRIDAPLTQWESNAYLPGVKDEEARNVLDELAEAVCGSWWIDEDNTARFQDMRSILRGPTAKELSFDDHVGEYTIEEMDTTRRDAIEVTYSKVAYSRFQRARVTLFQGKADRMESGDVVSYELKPKDEEEWIDADWYVRQWVDGVNTQIFMDQEGSWIMDFNPDKPAEKNTKRYWHTTTIVSPWSAILEVKAVGTIQLKLVDPPTPLREMDMPIVRGRGRMVRTDALERVGAWKPEAPFSLDARRWVTDWGTANALGQFLLNDLPPSKPSLSEVTVPYMPSIRLGTIIRIKAGYASSRDRRVVVLGVAHDPKQHESVLSTLEISSVRTNIQWTEAEANAVTAGSKSRYSVVEPARTSKDTWSKVEGDQTNYPYGV